MCIRDSRGVLLTFQFGQFGAGKSAGTGQRLPIVDIAKVASVEHLLAVGQLDAFAAATFLGGAQVLGVLGLLVLDLRCAAQLLDA